MLHFCRNLTLITQFVIILTIHLEIQINYLGGNMETSQSDSYPSIKFLKYVVYAICIVLFVFCYIKTDYSIKRENVESVITVKSEELFTSSNILTKFTANTVENIRSEEKITKNVASNVIEKEKQEVYVIYDNLTEQQLADKLNRSLPSTLSGTGYIFAKYTANTGMDPYLSVAIVLHETGCKWGCSDLVNTCYNVGGVKGAPGCYGGSYKAYSSLDEGINSFLDNLYYNYYSKGLTTPELINPYYAESTTWASAVNNYIYDVRNM